MGRSAPGRLEALLERTRRLHLSYIFRRPAHDSLGTKRVSCAMAVEICAYTFHLGAKTVGSQVVRTAVQGRTTVIEAKAQFQGVFGQQSLNQTSQLLSRTLHSLCFSEESSRGGEKRTFEVVFDAETGLVRASRRQGGQLEQSDAPYLRPYSDPLGLLQGLRQSFVGSSAGSPGSSTEMRRVPLLGKDVVIAPLGDSEVETALGTQQVAGFVLYPGPSYVYIATEPPHAIVRLVQPTEYGLLEALLTRRTEEEGTLETPASPEARSSKRRRRGGRKRRRVESS